MPIDFSCPVCYSSLLKPSEPHKPCPKCDTSTTNQPLTPEQLADSHLDEPFTTTPRAVAQKVKHAVQKATEAKDREIEANRRMIDLCARQLEDSNARLSEIVTVYENTITQIESQNEALQADKALLVEALQFYDYQSEHEEHHPGEWENRMSTVWGEPAREALTNTTQQAQARDARLIEQGRQKGIEEAAAALEQISFDHESFNGQELVNAKQAMKRLTQLKGGE